MGATFSVTLWLICLGRVINTFNPEMHYLHEHRAVPESIRAFVPAGRATSRWGRMAGRNDTRAALRRFFQVDAQSIVNAAKRSLG
jgi:pyruvate dehydrogenase complex dehydrogenase (E1) component